MTACREKNHETLTGRGEGFNSFGQPDRKNPVCITSLIRKDKINLWQRRNWTQFREYKVAAGPGGNGQVFLFDFRNKSTLLFDFPNNAYEGYLDQRIGKV